MHYLQNWQREGARLAAARLRSLPTTSDELARDAREPHRAPVSYSKNVAAAENERNGLGLDGSGEAYRVKREDGR